MDLMSIPERKFKIKIINMLMEVQKNIQELRNEFRSEIQSLNSTMEGIKSKLDMVEEKINEKKLENRNTKKLRHREKKGSLKMKEY